MQSEPGHSHRHLRLHRFGDAVAVYRKFGGADRRRDPGRGAGQPDRRHGAGVF